MVISPLSNKRFYALIILTFTYFVFLWLSRGGFSLFLWVVLTILVLASFSYEKKHLNKKGLIIVASIIVTYYFYHFLLYSIPAEIFNIFTFMRQLGLYEAIFIIFLPYILIYAYLMRDFWSWIDRELRTPLQIIMITVLAGTALYALNISYCFGVSAAEKGVSADSINFCEMLNMYHPVGTYDSKIGIIFALSLIPVIGAFLLYSWICVLYFIRRVWREK